MAVAMSAWEGNNAQDSHDDYRILIYECELRQIQAWTAKYPNLETGGDLFGLWLDDTTAVVQLVLGPGQNCNRTSTSFYQDVDYLDRVGKHLTSEEGLCHIGEWHSHHRLGLTRPSGGDENTVWTNMRRYGLKRFVLFISNIFSDKISVGCFFFKLNDVSNRRGYLLPNEGNFHYLTEKQSPIREKVKDKLHQGADSIITDREIQRQLLNHGHTDLPKEEPYKSPIHQFPSKKNKKNKRRRQSKSTGRNSATHHNNYNAAMDDQDGKPPKNVLDKQHHRRFLGTKT